MPKKSATCGRMFEDDGRTADVRGWQAAGLSLAAGGIAATRGPGAVAAVVALAPMVWAFGRLHRNAPSAGLTSDVVAKVLGGRAGLFTGLLQLVGYVLLAVGVSRGIGLAATLQLKRDLDLAAESWWWPVCAIIAAILAAALAYFCRTRLIVTIAAVMAAVGVLVYFYVALSAIARVATGTTPQLTGGVAPETGLGTSTLLIVLGLSLLGVEAVTTLNGRVSSVSRPIGSAMAVIALCAAAGWVAVALASGIVLAFDTTQIVVLASGLFADAGSIWVAALALACAALLAITLAAVRVASRLVQQTTGQSRVGPVTIVVVAVTSLLIVVATKDWGGAGSKLADVAPMLLIAVYVIAAEANSRLPGSSDAAMVLRVWMPTLAVVVVLVPLSYHELDAESLWTAALAATIGAVAALIAFRLPVDRSQIQPAP